MNHLSCLSAYKHRFSVDADIVIKEKDVEIFEETLKSEGFQKQQSRELEDIYASKFIRYEKKEPLISIDLMINALASRTTNASFSFDLIGMAGLVFGVDLIKVSDIRFI